jgi:hypothetical protein
MVVHDFNVHGLVILPTKADPELIIDPDTVLAFAIPL